MKPYDEKADLWSVGTILFQLLSKRTPYAGLNYMDLLRNIETTSVTDVPSFVRPVTAVAPLCRADAYAQLRCAGAADLPHSTHARWHARSGSCRSMSASQRPASTY